MTEPNLPTLTEFVTILCYLFYAAETPRLSLLKLAT